MRHLLALAIVSLALPAAAQQTTTVLNHGGSLGLFTLEVTTR